MEVITRQKIQKMKKLILNEKTQLVDPELVLQDESDKDPKVNFGTSNICSYSKH